MRITKHIPVQPMPFETCKNAVISDYQSYLEDVWVQNLRKKYSYSLNQSYFSLILAKNSQ